MVAEVLAVPGTAKVDVRDADAAQRLIYGPGVFRALLIAIPDDVDFLGSLQKLTMVILPFARPAWVRGGADAVRHASVAGVLLALHDPNRSLALVNSF